MVSGLVSQIPLPVVPHGEEGFIETIWLLLTSVVVVPIVTRLPGGSAVLGFLVGPMTLVYCLCRATWDWQPSFAGLTPHEQ